MFVEDAIIRRELLSILRSRRAFVCQFVFVALLSVVVYVAWPKEAHMVTAQAYIARRLFSIFALAQLTLISVLAPIPAASAVTSEKEGQTLGLLLSTPVPRRRIVTGKLVSSALLLVLLMLSGLPVLGQCYRLGGVSPAEVVWLYVTLATISFAFSAVGLACSVFCQRTHTAIASSYLVVIPAAAVLLTVLVRSDMRFNATLTIILVLNALGLTAMLVQNSCDRLSRGEFWQPPKPAWEEDPEQQQGLTLDPSRFPDKLLMPRRRPGFMPDGINPVFDREMRYEIFGSGTLSTRVIILAAFGLVVCLIKYWFVQQYVYVGFLMIFSAFVASAGSSRCITSEKERKTLPLLGTTLLRPRQVILGKLLSACRYSGVLTLLLLVPLVASNLPVLLGGSRGALPMHALFLAFLCVNLAFTGALGTCFSLVLPNTSASMVATYLALIVCYAGPVVVCEILGRFTETGADALAWIGHVSPLVALKSISDSVPDAFAGRYAYGGKPELGLMWLVTLVGYLALAAALTALAIRGFGKTYCRAVDKT